MAAEHPGIQLHLSNRLENLAHAFVKQLAQNPGHPLKPDTVLIQNRGMARWLNLRIADLAGIQMNTRYVYPRALVEELLSGVFSKSSEGNLSAYAGDVLFWRIYKDLPRWSKHPKAFLLKRYLDSKTEETTFLRRYQLAAKIASHVDQLQIYRPDLLRKWSRENEPDDWRALVWKELDTGSNEDSPPHLFDRFLSKLGGLKERPSVWPDHIHIFSVSSLPAVYVELLCAASTWMPVHVYLTQPSPLYWGDQLSRKKLLKANQPMEEPGHGLLGNLGRQGQDFLNTLIDAEVFADDESEYFAPSGSSQLLHQLQSDLYQLAPSTTGKTDAESGGIQVRICHSERREIEVLKDELLRRFEEENDLTPDQVVIMAPNIEDYAASIRSVLGPERTPSAALPYSIADYSARSSSSVAHALLSLLDLLQGRFTANEVLNFITLPAISERFEFEQDHWNIIRTWIEDTGIKWGIDGEHRKATTGTFFEEYAWQPGVDRLIAGSCIYPEIDSTWDPTMPHPGMEGSTLEVLNLFLELWQFLTSQRDLASQTFRISSWIDTIQEIVRYLFSNLESHADECQSILDILSSLEQEITVAQTNAPCDLRVIKSILEDRLSKDIQAGSFFTGSITFCSMMPMRNVPAQFVGLIGMHEEAFPRKDLKTEFNQFPDGTRQGDRSQKEDDRYLFLESILAARSHFYVSYTGIDSQTLNEEPASIVVEELLDSLDEYYRFPEEKSARETLVRKEPLQAFSPSNFQATTPHSYSQEDLKAAQALVGSKITPSGLRISEYQPEPEYPDAIRWEQFLRFFINPCQYWLTQRLQSQIPYQANTLEDSEPIEPDGLQLFNWGERILNDPDILSGKSEYRLSSLLPVGALGKSVYERLAPQIQDLLAQSNDLPQGEARTVQLDLKLNDLRISGRISNVTELNHKLMRFGNVRSTDILAGWIQHLMLSQHLSSPTFKTHLIGKNGTLSFSPVEHPDNHLQELKRLFVQGHDSALPFFVHTSYLFAKATLRPSSRTKKTPSEIAFSEFTKQIEYPFVIQGEAYNTFNQLCFPYPYEALSDAFQETSMSIFGPAIEHLEGGLP